MKVSEFLSRLEKLKAGVAKAIEADMIDNNTNINDMKIIIVDPWENEFLLDDVQIDLMGEPHRIMLLMEDL